MVRDLVVDQYPKFVPAEVIRIRDLLANTFFDSKVCETFTQAQLALGVAVLTKRAWPDTPPETTRQFMENLNQAMASDQGRHTLRATVLLGRLLDEFSNRSSVAMSVPLTFHLQCQRSFEVDYLLEYLKLVLNALHQGESQPDPNGWSESLRRQLVSLVGQILRWSFSETVSKTTPENDIQCLLTSLSNLQSDEHIDPDEDDQVPLTGSIRPIFYPRQWSSVIGNPTILDLLFTCYDKSLADTTLATTVIQCLCYLARVSELTFSSSNEHHRYLESFCRRHLVLIQALQSKSGGSLPGSCFYHIATVARHFLGALPFSALLTIPSMREHLDTLHQWTLLALSCIPATPTSDSNGNVNFNEDDRSWIQDAYEILLEMWVALTTTFKECVMSLANTPQPAHVAFVEYLREVCVTQVLHFADSQLQITTLPTDGTLVQPSLSQGLIEQESWIYPDEHYETQLTLVAHLARFHLSGGIPTLLAKVNNQIGHLFNPGTCDSTPILTVVRLQRLILIAGFILTDTSYGETALVPVEVLTCSAQSSPEVDPVLALIQAILGLASQVHSTSPFDTLRSPADLSLLIISLCWFMSRWSQVYLLADEEEYTTFNQNIANAYGVVSRPTTSSANITQELLGFIQYTLVEWRNYTPVLTAVVNLLQGIVENAVLCEYLCTLPMVTDWLPQLLPVLMEYPTAVCSPLVRALAGLVSVRSSTQILVPVSQSIVEQASSVLSTALAVAPGSSAPIDCIPAALKAVGLLTGLVQSATLRTITLVFSAIAPCLEGMVGLLLVYSDRHNLSETVLRFYTAVVEGLEYSLLSYSEQQYLCTVLNQLLQNCRQSNHVLISQKTSTTLSDIPSDDEWASQLVILLCRLLGTFIANAHGERETSDVQTQVIILGLNTITELMDQERFLEPDISKSLLRLAQDTVTYYWEQLASTSPNTVRLLMDVINKGLDLVSLRLKRLAYTSLTMVTRRIQIQYLVQSQSLAEHSVTTGLPRKLHHICPCPEELFAHILRTLQYRQERLFQLLFFQKVSGQSLRITGEAFIALVQWNPQLFQTLVQATLTRTSSDGLRQQLTTAFTSFHSIMESMHNQQCALVVQAVQHTLADNKEYSPRRSTLSLHSLLSSQHKNDRVAYKALLSVLVKTRGLL
ncbi:Exportin-4 [Dispira simplex]|nr:Exportin-4 [Dispira simplex]